MITTILFDLGETLVYLDKPTDEIVNARLHSLHSVLRNDGFDLQYPDLDGVYRVVIIFPRDSDRNNDSKNS